MSITDELRAWAKGSTLSSWTAEHLTAIADRIDAEHESACAEAYGNGVMSVPIALDESAWIELPKDADGEPIRVGDVMESDYSTRTEVAAVGVESFFAWSNIDRRWHQYEANQFRHRAPDTWERIIEDAFDAAIQGADERWDSDVDCDALVARCKTLCERTKEEDE